MNWPLVPQDHGKLFKSKFAGTYFIPLSHFSQVHFNKFLRNSYFDYLSEGLSEYIKIK